MANPAEIAYQPSRTVYYFRASVLVNTQVYNTLTNLYETYSASNWTKYAISIPEVFAGIYRGNVPAGSLSTPATEYFFDQKGGAPDVTDAPSIAAGNSQGVNIGTINGVQSSLGVNVTADTQIANLALNHLGQKQIASLTDSTENARRMNLVYATCRDEVLRAASWKFATVIKALTDISNTTTVPVGWTYAYQLPTDSILIRKCFTDDASVFDFPFFTNWTAGSISIPSTSPEPREFKVVYLPDLNAQAILSNLNPLYVEYTARMTNAGLFDPAFVKSLSYKLAAEVADVLTGKPQKGQQMMQLYQVSLSDASRLNAIEDGITQRRKSQYMDVR